MVMEILPKKRRNYKTIPVQVVLQVEFNRGKT
jgi:hypothetical protein